MFLTEAPHGCFTDESLQEIVKGCEYFPAYAVLKTALETWVGDHPTVPRVTHQVSESLRRRIDELQNNQEHQDRETARLAEIKADWSDPAVIRRSLAKIEPDHPMRDMLGRMLAGLVRKHTPENLGYVPPEFHGWLK